MYNETDQNKHMNKEKITCSYIFNDNDAVWDKDAFLWELTTPDDSG